MINYLALPDLVSKLAEQSQKYAVDQRVAEMGLQKIENQIVGRRVKGRFSTANLKGEYEITDVRLSYDFTICAHGRKVLGNGKLGSQRWDLGELNRTRLGL